MTPDVNEILDEMRQELRKVLAETESPSSPETPEVGANSHGAGSAGVGEADNISDANDAVDKYLANIVAQLVLTTNMGEDEAFDLVFDFFDDESEHIPALPDEDADPEELMMWLGKATTFGADKKILKLAQGG